MTPALETRALTVAYRGQAEPALRAIDLQIAPGQTVGLLGPNGSGKTSLLRVLATLLPPTDGTASVLGLDAARQRAQVRRLIGVLFQSPALDRELTGTENLWCHGRLFGMPGDLIRTRGRELLTAVGMAGRADEPVKRLSGGMRRRLEIAKVLLPAPPLVLMDEPTVGLDPAARRQVWQMLHELRSRSDPPSTLLVSTHLMEDAAACDRLVLIDRGRIVAQDTPEALIDGIGGDVVRFVPGESCTSADLAAALVRHLGEPAERVHATPEAVRIERPRGHELVTRFLESAGPLGLSIREASVGRPTLEDVFVQLTGRGLDAGEAQRHDGPTPRNGR